MPIVLSDARYITINGFVSTNENDFKIYSNCSEKDSRDLALYSLVPCQCIHFQGSG